MMWLAEQHPVTVLVLWIGAAAVVLWSLGREGRVVVAGLVVLGVVGVAVLIGTAARLPVDAPLWPLAIGGLMALGSLGALVVCAVLGTVRRVIDGLRGNPGR